MDAARPGVRGHRPPPRAAGASGAWPTTSTGCAASASASSRRSAGGSPRSSRSRRSSSATARGAIAVLEEVLGLARDAGTLSILDVKRGDIGSTMAGYADAYLRDGAPLAADAVTLSPYLGFGSLRPALDAARASGRGVFVLALTSNPEGAEVQHAFGVEGSVAGQMVAGARGGERRRRRRPARVGRPGGRRDRRRGGAGPQPRPRRRARPAPRPRRGCPGRRRGRARGGVRRRARRRCSRPPRAACCAPGRTARRCAAPWPRRSTRPGRPWRADVAGRGSGPAPTSPRRGRSGCEVAGPSCASTCRPAAPCRLRSLHRAPADPAVDGGARRPVARRAAHRGRAARARRRAGRPGGPGRRRPPPRATGPAAAARPHRPAAVRPRRAPRLAGAPAAAARA